MTDETIAPVQDAPKAKGWPKGLKRGPRTPRTEREPQRASQRVSTYSGSRTPTGRISVSDDPYFIDVESEVPEGMTWQWVTRTVMGKDDGKMRMHYASMLRNGWVPVDAARVPQYGVVSGEVDLGGLVLCERPKEMTDEAQAEDYARATGQVRSQIQGLENTPPDSLPRKTKDHNMVSVRRGEPIQVRGDSEE